MKKPLHINYSFILYFFTFFYSSTYLKAQTTGELIPFSLIYPGEGESSTIRGDMKVIGNSILGIKEEEFQPSPIISIIGEDEYLNISIGPNDDYNGSSPNNQISRAYIDIDSDSKFNSLFNNSLPDSERSYSEPYNDFGSPLNPPTISTTGTFSSSAAELIIDKESNVTDQICSKVIKAFLYWGAIYPAESQSMGIEGDEENDITELSRPDCNGCEHYTDIKVLPPGATEYISIKESNTGIDYTLANSNTSLKSRVLIDGIAGGEYSYSSTETIKDSPYVCVADITSLFTFMQNSNELIQGNWTVGNVRATTGHKNSGSAGGWSLVVIYENPLSNIQKNISLFEGFANVTSNQTQGNERSDMTEFNISGFETIPNGPVNVDIAVIGLEGDDRLTGDQFQINIPNDDGSKSDEWFALSYEDSNPLNFYDSSIYSKGEINRYPNSSNTLGYDSDHFTIDNNNYIGNSDTSADFRLFTFSDSFLNFFTGFATEIISTESQLVEDCITLSIDSLENERSQIIIYPTIAKNTMYIKNQTFKDIETLEVYDLSGQLLISKTNILESETPLNISQLSNGIYLIKVTSKNGNIIKKFIKN